MERFDCYEGTSAKAKLSQDLYVQGVNFFARKPPRSSGDGPAGRAGIGGARWGCRFVRSISLRPVISAVVILTGVGLTASPFRSGKSL